MGTFKNEFSWSVSRDGIFRKCPRMYYFQYYGSWGGWEADTDKKTRMIYILKQLQSRQMWAGTKVHECIELNIKKTQQGHRSVNVDKVTDKTLNIMRQEFKSSRKKEYLENPKLCALFEHEYEIALPKTEWENIANHVVECLKLFFSSGIYKEILQLSDNQWLKLEQFDNFYFKDEKIYAAPDFAFYKDDEIIVYDWKTGNEEPERDTFQLACYGLFVIQKRDIKPDKVKLVDFFLSNGKLIEYMLIDFNLDQIQKKIWSSIVEMREMLENPNENIAKEDNFPFSKNEMICKLCNFKKICSYQNNIKKLK